MSVNELTGPDETQGSWRAVRLGSWATEQRIRWALGLAIVLATALRITISSLSIGSEDARLWLEFAKNISRVGVIQTYFDRGDFNHPPLMALHGWLSYELSQLLHLRFSAVFRVPVIASDALAAWLLWRIWRHAGTGTAAGVVAAFGFNLISISVGAYHCNTDCLLANLCLAAAYAFSRGHWRWAGFLLGAAINVKIVPLMLVPVLALSLPSRRALLEFGLPLLLCSLPFVPVAVLAWPMLVNNVLGYNSIPFQWGSVLFMLESKRTLPAVSAWLRDSYMPSARFIILGLMFAIGLLQRRLKTLDTFELGALAFSILLVLAPGFGIQYLAWPVSLLFAANPRWANRYAVVGGAFAVLVYYVFWTGTRPWFSHFHNFPPPVPSVGLLAWSVLVAYTIASFRKLLGFETAV
jgi:hypothetical protein